MQVDKTSNTNCSQGLVAGVICPGMVSIQIPIPHNHLLYPNNGIQVWCITVQSGTWCPSGVVW